jgi:hypothetical protein
MLLNISFHFDYFPLLVVAAIAWGTPIVLSLFNLLQVLLHDNIITRSSTSEIEQRLKNLGVKTIDVIGVLATTTENLILRPATYHVLVESFENFSVEEILITSNEADRLQVKEIPFHADAILMMG